jgi:hypothetical protein
MFKKGLKNHPIEASGLHRMDGKGSAKSRRAKAGENITGSLGMFQSGPT